MRSPDGTLLLFLDLFSNRNNTRVGPVSVFRQKCMWLVLVRWSFRISVGTSTILTEVYRNFPQSLQENSS